MSDQKTVTTCQNFATFRYTWPGKDEAFCCTMHAKGIRAVADALGLYQQFIPITPCIEQDHPMCSSQVTTSEQESMVSHET